MRQTAFVTGASGFLGSRLVRELDAQGWDVHVLARNSSSLEEVDDLPLTIHRGDITDEASLHRALPRDTDALFHVAASTSVWSGNDREQERINVDGTRHVIRAATAAGVGRLVHTSSFTTWGFQDIEINERSERTDASDWINYVRTKHLAEEAVADAVRQGEIEAVILNPGHILGPGDRNNWSRMIALIDRGKLPGVPPGSGPFADVDEVARAHVSAFHRGRNGEKYLLGGNCVPFLELVRLTGEILDRPVPQNATPGWVLKAAARLYAGWSLISGKAPDLTPETAAMVTRNLLCDSSRAQSELDYRFTDVRTLLEKTIEWMEARGMLVTQR